MYSMRKSMVYFLIFTLVTSLIAYRLVIKSYATSDEEIDGSYGVIPVMELSEEHP